MNLVCVARPCLSTFFVVVVSLTLRFIVNAGKIFLFITALIKISLS